MFPIRSVTLAAILEPRAVVDLAGGASVAAAFTCASALQTSEIGLLREAAFLCCLKGVGAVELLKALPFTRFELHTCSQLAVKDPANMLGNA